MNSRIIKSVALMIIVAIMGMCVSHSVADSVVISDNEFNAADWTHVQTDEALGMMTDVFFGQTTIGFPQSGNNVLEQIIDYSVTTVPRNGADVVSYKHDSGFTTAQNSAITTIDFSVDRRTADGVLGGPFWNVLIEQGGVFYTRPFMNDNNISTTNLVNFTETDLVAQDFGELLLNTGGGGIAGLDFSSNPDFTDQGAELHFGIYSEAYTVSSNQQIWGGYWDNLSVTIHFEAVPPSLEIDRLTGDMTFNSPTTQNGILGYSITSAAGSLDPTQWLSIAENYDSNSGGAVDPNHTWIELSGPSSRTDFSEFSPRGSGVTLAAGQTIDLGHGVWAGSPVEDVQMDLLYSDGTIESLLVYFVGNGDVPIASGDISGPTGRPDGTIDLLDWVAFKAGFGSDTAGLTISQTYQLGDLDSDLDIDIFDAGLFEEAFDAANGAGAFAGMLASVPEPSTWLLGVIPASIAILFARRHPLNRAGAFFGILVILQVSGIAIAGVRTVVSDGDFADWTHVPHEVLGLSNMGDFFDVGQENLGGNLVVGHLIHKENSEAGRQGGELVSYANTGFDIAAEAAAVVSASFSVDVQRHTEAANGGPFWSFAIEQDGVVYARPFTNSTGTTSFTPFTQMDLVATDFFELPRDNGGGAQLVAGSHPNFSGGGPLHFGFYSEAYLTTSAQFSYGGQFDAFEVTVVTAPLLTLEVNTTTGSMRIVHESENEVVDFDVYSIKSLSGALNPSGFSSLEDNITGGFGDGVPDNGIGWEVLGTPSSNELAEQKLFGSTAFNQGDSVTLGPSFSPGGLQDLEFHFHTAGGAIFDGVVSYISGPMLDGDYNLDGIVDAADYTVWRDTLNQTGAGLRADGNGDMIVDDLDYAFWKTHFGSTSASGAAAADLGTVPEPTTLPLLLSASAFFLLCCRRTGLHAFLMAYTAMLLPAQSVFADAFIDRDYTFGDDLSEGAVVGNTLGQAASGVTYDSAGTLGLGDLQDLLVHGAPSYADVADRPGADVGDLGAAFNGSGDYVNTPISMSGPGGMWNNALFFPPGSEFPHNYSNIAAHGIQLWIKPNSGTQDRQQDVILDTLENGVVITPNNTWGLRFDNDPNVDSGEAVDFDEWTHVMQLAGFADRTKGKAFGPAALYVNGIAVAVRDSEYENQSTGLSIGSNLGGTDNFFHGVLDDVRLFLWGDNSTVPPGPDGQLGGDWGTLNLGEDNDWIAQQLVSLGVTNPADVNLDGMVFGDGSGPPATDDLSRLIETWSSVREIDGVQVGDWISRQNGDLNYDGIVNLADAFILHEGLIAAGVGAGLDFSLLPSGGGVPEPNSFMLISIAFVGLVLAGPRKPTRFSAKLSATHNGGCDDGSHW